METFSKVYARRRKREALIIGKVLDVKILARRPCFSISRKFSTYSMDGSIFQNVICILKEAIAVADNLMRMMTQ